MAALPGDIGRPRSHRDLIVWQKSMDLVVMVHKLVDESPERRGWRIVDQLSRAVVSVPSNIAEGNARGTPRDYANFISIAKGSLIESETLILSAVRLEYVPASAAQPILDLIIEVSKMLTTLRSRLLKQR